MELVPVYRGPLPEILALRASLGAEGIETVIRNENIKSIDPFITGGAIFDATLLAPEDAAQEAARSIRELRGRHDDSERATEAASEPSRAEALGKRIRWSCAAFLFAPLALYLTPAYLREARKGQPPGHGSTLFAIAVACVEVLAMVAVALNVALV